MIMADARQVITETMNLKSAKSILIWVLQAYADNTDRQVAEMAVSDAAADASIIKHTMNAAALDMSYVTDETISPREKHYKYYYLQLKSYY